MKKALLITRKEGRKIQVYNMLNHHIATVEENAVTFHEPVTQYELDRINSIAQDFSFMIENLTEE